MSLTSAVLDNDRRLLFLEIFHDSDLNSANDIGNTALHACAYKNNSSFLDVLIKAGAKTDVRNHRGWTPLHVGASLGHERVVEALLRCGADPAAKDERGFTPRDVAVGEGCQKALERWLDEVLWEMGGRGEEGRAGRSGEHGDELLRALTARRERGEAMGPVPMDHVDEALRVGEMVREGQSRGGDKLLRALAARRMREEAMVMMPMEMDSVDKALRVGEFKIEPFGENGMPVLPRSENPKKASPRSAKIFSSPPSNSLDVTLITQNDTSFGACSRQDDLYGDGGFYVEIDGANVFVPVSPSLFQPALLDERISHLISTGADCRASSPIRAIEGAKLESKDEEIESVRMSIVEMKFSLSDATSNDKDGIVQKSRKSLGILLVENDGRVCVQQIKRKTAAFLVLKKHDVIIGINGQSVIDSTLTEVVGLLAAARSGALGIEIERVLPKIVVIASGGEFNLNDEHGERGFRELVAVLRDPPANLTQDQTMTMIHTFQEIISVIRRGEASARIMQAVEIEFPPTQGEMTEQAAVVVHRAIRFGLEDEQVSGDGALGFEEDEEDSLLRNVLDEIFSN